MPQTTKADRRRSTDEPTAYINFEQAGSGNPAASFGGPYQGSAEPFRKPDHKAKRHTRPANWNERQARRQRREREYAA